MSTTPPPPFSLAGCLSNLLSGDEGLISPSAITAATTTATVIATPTPVDNAVRAILMQNLPLQATAKPTEVTQTSDYGEPSKPSFLRLTSLRLSKRVKKLLVSTHLKKGKAKAVLPRAPLVYLSDDGSRVSPRTTVVRGRSLTSRPTRGVRPLPLYELHDDGQGSWVDKFGYIYRAGLDTSRSDLHRSCDDDAGTAHVEAGCHPCRVYSRVPEGSLKVGGDGFGGKDSRDSEAPGCAPFESSETQDQRFLEGQVAEVVFGSHDMSEDGNSCRGPKNECDERF
jgi:predicted nucleic acid-binding Zn ribbon protein